MFIASLSHVSPHPLSLQFLFTEAGNPFKRWNKWKKQGGDWVQPEDACSSLFP